MENQRSLSETRNSITEHFSLDFIGRSMFGKDIITKPVNPLQRALDGVSGKERICGRYTVVGCRALRIARPRGTKRSSIR